jgi:hypothetical protein
MNDGLIILNGPKTVLSASRIGPRLRIISTSSYKGIYHCPSSFEQWIPVRMRPLNKGTQSIGAIDIDHLRLWRGSLLIHGDIRNRCPIRREGVSFVDFQGLKGNGA